MMMVYTIKMFRQFSLFFLITLPLMLPIYCIIFILDILFKVIGLQMKRYK